MTRQVYRFDSKRPSLRSFPGDALARRASRRFGSTPTELAPAAAGLKPVMGEPGLPLVGKLVEMIRNPEPVVRDMYQRYGSVYWTGMFGEKLTWVVTPEGAQQVLANKGKVFSQSGWEYFIGPFFRRGLMLLDGEEHHLHRRIMQEAFTRPRLEGYLTEMNAVIDRVVPTWETDVPFLVFPAVKQLSLDIATHVFMGAEPGADADRLTDAFVDTVRAGAGIVRRPVPGMPFLRWIRERK